MNHRGQQSYGLLVHHDGFRSVKGLGPLPESLPRGARRFFGDRGIGHVRYVTSGGYTRKQMLVDAQPCVVEHSGRRLAIAYNGNVANSVEFRRSLERRGIELHCTSDAELIAYEILLSLGEGLAGAASRLASRVDGAYSLVGMTDDGTLFALRDPMGIKPLFYGSSPELTMIASETVALDINGLSSSPVAPGELLIVSGGEVTGRRITGSGRANLCAFEYAYFARPDSRLDDGRYVYEVRRELGRRLARRHPDVVERIDIVVPVPETAVDAAYGFHEETGKPMEPVIVRNRFVRHRAFMASPASRAEILAKKYNVIAGRASGRRIALMDDSIVRGDTLKVIISMLREAGAREVHVFSTFPKIVGPCFYGVDMATYGELIGFNRDEEGVAQILGADTVNYQTVEDFLDAVGDDVCMACVTGRYPTPYAAKLARLALKGNLPRGRIVEVIG